MSAKCYQKLFYSKRKKNLVTRLYIKRNKDFFESPLKTFPLEITILAVVELIEKLEEIKKNIRTWVCGTWVMALLKGGHKFLFSTGEIFCQKRLYHIAAMISLKRFRVVTQCYAASVSIKTHFCKTNNIFYSLEKRIWDKTN